MLDEDIEYIGTRPAHNSFENDPFHPSPKIVTGIILRVEKSADDPACTLTFHRSTSSVVHIGRRPSNEERVKTDSEGAMFRCAVVSRKHAKIAFSDSGHAYLIDMNSHHGTHVRKPGEAVSKTIKPETPTKLADGDVLTFGKSVGRPNECVRPVVARVELIHSRGPESPFKPMTPVKQNNHVDLTRSPPPRSSTGRYGVYVPRSPSPGNLSCGMSDHDSDIEEIPASGANALPLQPRGRRSPEPESHLGRAFEALKKLLPPVHVPGSAGTESRSAVSSSPLPKWRSSPSLFDTPPQFESPQIESPIYSPCSPAGTNSPHSGQASPIFGTGSQSPSFSASSYPHSAGPFPPSVSHRETKGLEDRRHSQGRSRSTSSMDIASLSPVSLRRSLSPEQFAQGEPSIVGAWPGSRSSSPEHLRSPVPDEAPGGVDEFAAEGPVSAPSIQNAMSIDSICSEPHSQPSQNVEAAVEETVAVPPDEAANEVEAIKTEEEFSAEVSELQASLKKLQGEVAKLQTHRRKYKARFNANVHLISDKLTDLDERVSDVNAQYTMLLDRVDNTADVDIPDLQAQVDALRDQAEAFPTVATEPMLHERSDVKASIETLRELVLEMGNLQESTQKQMSAELEVVRAARDAALATIAAHVEAQTSALAPTPSLAVTSLKRKRDDYAEDEDTKADGDRECAFVEIGAVGASDVAVVKVAAAAGPTTFANAVTTGACHDRVHDMPLPRPRNAPGGSPRLQCRPPPL
ncbi:putative FHA domain containing protein [Lyophyllum shimeji]|uniref:FHA domain containing protein n=1 Tax=Lyophyllum shimeji TaxID=47721 RepID=A0A9P3PWH6_LYOSH|nr:putative FHA domain containing protein [Lyophyllum shimeji]